MAEGYEVLSDLDMLVPNPANRKEAMGNERLKPFWLDSEKKEMSGLWRRQCFKKWRRSELLQDDRVFAS